MNNWNDLYVEPTPLVSIDSPHLGYVKWLVELGDGSFVSCGEDTRVIRWCITGAEIKLLGTFIGHTCSVWCAVENRDKMTLITGSGDKTLAEWNISTCDRVNSVLVRSHVRIMVITKDRTSLVCGLGDGSVEVRRPDGLDLIAEFPMHSYRPSCICELDDGSFVSAAKRRLKRWNKEGKLLQTFSGHSNYVLRVLQLGSGVIVSAAEDRSLKMWRVSSEEQETTTECIRTMTSHSAAVFALAKLSTNKFVSGAFDNKIIVWNEQGDCIETIDSEYEILGLIRVRDYLVVSHLRSLFMKTGLQVRRIK